MKRDFLFDCHVMCGCARGLRSFPFLGHETQIYDFFFAALLYTLTTGRPDDSTLAHDFSIDEFINGS